MPLGVSIEGAMPLVTAIAVRRRVERGLRMTLFVALCAILIFGPLALGSVQDWSTAMFEGGSALVLVMWMTWQLTAGDIKLRWNPLFAPMLVFFGIVLAQILFHRSVYLYDTLSELWLYIAYGILMFVAAQLILPEKESTFVLRFGKIMALFGAVYAVFAVVQGFTSGGRIYWYIKPRAGSVYGSYVNHNHYAGLMELLFPFALILAFNGSIRGPKRVLLGFAATLMAASVFLCGSRGGMIAIVVETVFLAIYWMRQFSPRRSATLFVAFFLATALFLAWVAPQQVGNRISDTHDPARWLIHRDAIRMFAAHPLLGTGFGTFATAFPRYREFYDRFLINHAHDDYLELLLETGLAGFGMGLWFVVTLYREGLRNLRRGRFSATAMIRIAALAGCTGLLSHSFTDFNLHVPANAALFFVSCVIATTPRL